jgi:hypothetical protein
VPARDSRVTAQTREVAICRDFPEALCTPQDNDEHGLEDVEGEGRRVTMTTEPGQAHHRDDCALEFALTMIAVP